MSAAYIVIAYLEMIDHTNDWFYMAGSTNLHLTAIDEIMLLFDTYVYETSR